MPGKFLIKVFKKSEKNCDSDTCTAFSSLLTIAASSPLKTRLRADSLNEDPILSEFTNTLLLTQNLLNINTSLN